MGKRNDREWSGTLRKADLDRIGAAGYYRDSVVDGLKRRVQQTGSGIAESWVLRVEIDGQDTHLGLGSSPAVSQEEARRRAWAAQDEIAAKRDPRRRNDPTVRQMGDKIVAERSSSDTIWASDGTRKRWLHDLSTHIYPKIGKLGVRAVRPVDIMECVVPLMREYPETARQVFSHLRVIFARAVAENLRGDDPTEAVAAALGPIHPRRRNRPLPAPSYQQMPEVLQRVRESDAHPSTKGVCELMVFTGTRQSEARGVRWDEINRNEALLCLPSRRTKTRQPLVIPLSGPVLAVLDDAWERTGGVGLVFPSATGRPISPATLGKLLKSLGLSFVPHGLRSSYRTYMSEHGIPDKVAELALGHTHPSVPAGIDLLEQRRQAIEQWGQYLTENRGPDQPNPPPPSGREDGGTRD